MPYRPLFDRVVAKEIPQEEVVSDGGILISKTAIAAAHTRATVIAIGDDVKAFNVGDTILFSQGQGNPILVDGQELLLLRAEQVDIVL